MKHKQATDMLSSLLLSVAASILFRVLCYRSLSPLVYFLFAPSLFCFRMIQSFVRDVLISLLYHGACGKGSFERFYNVCDYELSA